MAFHCLPAAPFSTSTAASRPQDLLSAPAQAHSKLLQQPRDLRSTALSRYSRVKDGRRSVKTAAQPQQQAPEGQVPSEILEAMKAKITEALDAESVQISDAYGDGRHVSIDVIASSFEGKNSVKRQQAVYKAIWLELQDTVHAVDAMTTKTPAEAR